MNKVTTVARIGKDAAVVGEKDTKLLKFTAACTVGWGDREQTVWYDVQAFVSGGAVERAQKFAGSLAKGNQVAVCGDLSFREYEGKKYPVITTTMNDIKVVTYKNPKPEASAPNDEAVPTDTSDDLPF